MRLWKILLMLLFSLIGSSPLASANNRNSAQFGSQGSFQTISYAVNNLNEYTNISTPGYKDIIGVAIATNGVTVNGAATDRKGEYYHRQMTIFNSGGPVL
jgi:hypothetical protein